MSDVIRGKFPKLAPLRGLSGEGEIPFDVTFKIVGNSNSSVDENESSVDVHDKEIMAHKFIMAACSPVFKKMFYGVMKETSDIIPVKHTTADAFSRLIDYIYQVDICCEGMTILETFDLVNLAERYDVPELMDELTEQMKLVPITMKNIMEVATTANKFSHFEAASSALMLTCAKHFQEKVNKAEDQVKYMVARHKEGNGTVALILLSLVETLPPIKCSNCNEKVCLKKTAVARSKIVEGLKVQVNKACNTYWGANGGQWADVHYTLGNVNSAQSFQLKEGNGVVMVSVPYTYNGVLTLIYDC